MISWFFRNSKAIARLDARLDEELASLDARLDAELAWLSRTSWQLSELTEQLSTVTTLPGLMDDIEERVSSLHKANQILGATAQRWETAFDRCRAELMRCNLPEAALRDLNDDLRRILSAR